MCVCVCVYIESSSCNIYSDITYLFRFCIGSCFIFICIQIICLFANYLYSKIYLRDFLFI